MPVTPSTTDAHRESEIRRRYRAFELSLREATMLVDHDGDVVSVRDADRLIGVDPTCLRGGPPVPSGWTVTDDSGAQVEIDDHPATLTRRTGQGAARILTYHPPCGSRGARRLTFTACPVVGDPDVAVDLWISDPERRERVRHDLVTQSSRFETLTDVLPVGVWEASPAGQFTYVNPTFTELTGLGVEEVPDLPAFGIVHPDDEIVVMGALSELGRGRPFRAQYRIVHVDGSWRWVISRVNLVTDDDGEVIGYVGALEDVHELHESRRRTDRLASIVEAAGDAIVTFDVDTDTYLNEAARLLLARFDRSAPSTAEPFGAQLAARYVEELEPILLAEGAWSGEARFVDVHGDAIDLWMSVTAEIVDGRVVRYVMMARDIHEQKAREAALRRAATHDPLTGLANRAGFVEALLDANGRTGALMYVDIDHFKAVNDAHGHGAGDDVLVEVARRVGSCVPEGSVVARVGGDEIVVWVPDGTAAADQIAGRVVSAISSAPVAIERAVSGHERCRVSVTIGVATGRADEAEELIRRADAALYVAKAGGRDGFHVDGPDGAGAPGVS
ncbi:diguanylate cyclase domain-containing protein [Ilumatobacter sp.]|uniref:sensor domain-containing protein n=1 Tax=Ilumatobacter sp. TaxID=1967498 RepID=UPI003B5207DF